METPIKVGTDTIDKQKGSDILKKLILLSLFIFLITGCSSDTQKTTKTTAICNIEDEYVYINVKSYYYRKNGVIVIEADDGNDYEFSSINCSLKTETINDKTLKEMLEDR